MNIAVVVFIEKNVISIMSLLLHVSDIAYLDIIQCHPKKLFHKSEEKMQGKMKKILQKDENLVHIQLQLNLAITDPRVTEIRLQWM